MKPESRWERPRHAPSPTALAIVALSLLSAAAKADVLTEQAQLTQPGPVFGDWFGIAVAIDGDVAVVGAPNPHGFMGAAHTIYLYDRQDTSWSYNTQFDSFEYPSSLGISCDVDADTVVAGDISQGMVLVVVREGTSWVEEAQITAPPGIGNFGYSLALSGDRLVVGAPYQSAGIETVFVYTRTAGIWTLEAALVGLDSMADDGFGESVDIDGDTILIGASEARNLAAQSTGAAYVFTRATPVPVWTQQQKLLASDGQSGDDFGRSVALDGNLAIVGAPGDDDLGAESGSCYYFELQGSTWSQDAKCKPHAGQPGDEFGHSVSISGPTAVIAAPFHEGPNGGASTAFAFERIGGTWYCAGTLDPGNSKSVANEGETVVVGSFFGAVHVYVPAPPPPPTVFCASDGSGTACPCGNDSTQADEGCTNSSGAGARLELASGSGHSISAADLQLLATQLPPGNGGIFLVGTGTTAGVAVFDGVHCVGGSTLRLNAGFETSSGERLSGDDGAHGMSLITQGSLAAPAGGGQYYFCAGFRYYFQYWFRDVSTGMSPCGSGANFSAGLAVTLCP